jgi:hypothetical protein
MRPSSQDKVPVRHALNRRASDLSPRQWLWQRRNCAALGAPTSRVCTMRRLHATTYRFPRRARRRDLRKLTARFPGAPPAAGINTHYWRPDGKGGFVVHELAGDSARESEAAQGNGHEPGGSSHGIQMPPGPGLGNSRPNHAPGVYQIGLPLLCAGEQQGPLVITASSRRPRTTGEPVAADKFVLKHHQVEAAGRARTSDRGRETPKLGDPAVIVGQA